MGDREAEQKNVSWRAFQHEDPDSYEPPTPPIVLPGLAGADDEQLNVDWRVRQADDTETRSTLPPVPPVVPRFGLTDDDSARWVGVRSIDRAVDDDAEAPGQPVTFKFGVLMARMIASIASLGAAAIVSLANLLSSEIDFESTLDLQTLSSESDLTCTAIQSVPTLGATDIESST